MRRRRQKNTLLPKMLGLAVLVNAILLPILAQLGVFKGITGQRLTPVQLVQAPPPPPKPKERARRNRPHVVHHSQTARRAAPREASRSTEPKVRVVATPSTGTGNSGEGNSGITTSEGPTDGNSTVKPPNGPVTPPITPPVTPPPTPTPPVAPPPAPVAPPPPHIPVTTAPTVVQEVRPTIPADFAEEHLPVTFRAAFHVHLDGTATVEVLDSTGDKTLDRLALEAAQRWTFRPATEDGKPVDGGCLRLRVDFVPNDEG